MQIVHDLGLTPVGFSVNADNGATSPAGKVGAAIMGAAPGSIVLAHMNHPASGTSRRRGDRHSGAERSRMGVRPVGRQSVQ